MNADPAAYDYDTPTMNRMLSGGKMTRGLGRIVRFWIRQGRIQGVYQHDKAAKYWFNAYGILEAWKLWAKREGLDYEADMPPDVELLRDVIQEAQTTVAQAPLVPPQGQGIVVIAPPGIPVQVVYQPPAA